MKKITFLAVFLLAACNPAGSEKEKEDSSDKLNKIWLIGDSTMADYSNHPKYEASGGLAAGWGQVFQQFFTPKGLDSLSAILSVDSVIVKDKAVGGRTTKSFFEEGKWRAVYDSLQAGDIVIIQFGHNDAAIRLHPILKERGYPEFVHLGYKEFLRLFVSQSREKGAFPILLTPVARNYPWVDGHLENVHGDFPESVKIVAEEMNVPLIDLNQLSMDFFSTKGEEYVTERYFMNIAPGIYEAYPDGLKDNTHFKTEGAIEVARLVFEGMKDIARKE